MKKILSLALSLALVLFSACSKKSSPEITEPPPDPGSTGEVKATLTFSTGSIIVVNATGNSTLFNRLIDVANNDTILTITGSVANYKQLNVRLTNISSPGTFPFITNQAAPPEEGYPQCEYLDWTANEMYSTLQIRTDPGSVTIETITSNYVSGYFNSQVTNWYPGRPDAGSTITINSGSFKGKFRTSSY